MLHRIVLDTNVVVSGLMSPHGPPAQVLDLVLAGELLLLLDDRLMEEYHEVAHRPKFGFRPADVGRVLDAIGAGGERVTARPLAVTLPDVTDLPFLEVAAAGRADALVTGNRRHFAPVGGRAHDVPLRTPRELLDELRGAE